MAKIKPNMYKQIDSRYSGIKGAGTTLGASGCGPTACANAISKLTNPNVTPKHTFKWACANGYMTSNQGLYWGGIKAMLAHWGVKDVEQTTDQKKVKKSLEKGYWAIAIMGPGLWTRGGHFILLYNYSNGYVDISDSASYERARAHAKFSTWAAQNYNDTSWLIIDPSQYKLPKEQREKADKKSIGKSATLYVSDKDGAKVHEKANAKSDVKGTIKFNKKLKLKYAGNKWYKVASGSLKGTYIRATHLSKYKQKRVKYETKTLMNIRDGYTGKAEAIGTVKKGTVIISTKQRGRWAYFPKQKGVAKAGWVKVKDDKKVYLKTVK